VRGRGRDRMCIYVRDRKRERDRIDFKKLAIGSLDAESLINPTTTVRMSI
jgi:hypothetical protein